MPDICDFILQNLRLEAAAGLPEIVLYRAHAGSRLSRMGETPPYWAYHWAGGTVLAQQRVSCEPPGDMPKPPK